ncbi:hypothetical protein ACXNSR_29105 [Streptomyces sp. NC-S4]
MHRPDADPFAGPPEGPQADGDEAATRFEALLRANRTPEVVEGVLGALGFREGRGGYRVYSKAAGTSCFPTLDAGRPNAPRTLWPIGVHPVSGTAEVVFQCLKRRPPFDDEPLRRALMERFNAIDGIDLAEAELDLRPPSRWRSSPRTARRSAEYWSGSSARSPRPRPAARSTTATRRPTDPGDAAGRRCRFLPFTGFSGSRRAGRPVP